MESLSNKTLVMVVGPSAVGKSTLMHEVTRLDDRFTYVQSFTTRPRRQHEESTYLHLTDEEVNKIKDSGVSVTYFKHPTTGIVYGTVAESYRSEYNLLDTLSGTVEKYRSLPFESTVTVSVCTEADAWTEWIQKRYPAGSAERVKRLEEAISSIAWSLAQTDEHAWIVNEPGDVDAAARKLIELTSMPARISPAIPPQATKLLDAAKTLLSYE